MSHSVASFLRKIPGCVLCSMHRFEGGNKCVQCGRTAQQVLDIGPGQTILDLYHTSRRRKPLVVKNPASTIAQSCFKGIGIVVAVTGTVHLDANYFERASILDEATGTMLGDAPY